MFILTPSQTSGLRAAMDSEAKQESHAILEGVRKAGDVVHPLNTRLLVEIPSKVEASAGAAGNAGIAGIAGNTGDDVSFSLRDTKHPIDGPEMIRGVSKEACSSFPVDAAAEAQILNPSKAHAQDRGLARSQLPEQGSPPDLGSKQEEEVSSKYGEPACSSEQRFPASQGAVEKSSGEAHVSTGDEKQLEGCLAQLERGVTQPERIDTQPGEGVKQPEGGLTQPGGGVTQQEGAVTQREIAGKPEASPVTGGSSRETSGSIAAAGTEAKKRKRDGNADDDNPENWSEKRRRHEERMAHARALKEQALREKAEKRRIHLEEMERNKREKEERLQRNREAQALAQRVKQAKRRQHDEVLAGHLKETAGVDPVVFLNPSATQNQAALELREVHYTIDLIALADALSRSLSSAVGEVQDVLLPNPQLQMTGSGAHFRVIFQTPENAQRALDVGPQELPFALVIPRPASAPSWMSLWESTAAGGPMGPAASTKDNQGQVQEQSSAGAATAAGVNPQAGAKHAAKRGKASMWCHTEEPLPPALIKLGMDPVADAAKMQLSEELGPVSCAQYMFKKRLGIKLGSEAAIDRALKGAFSVTINGVDYALPRFVRGLPNPEESANLVKRGAENVDGGSTGANGRA